jgi:hypothetical protein
VVRVWPATNDLRTDDQGPTTDDQPAYFVLREHSPKNFLFAAETNFPNQGSATQIDAG